MEKKTIVDQVEVKRDGTMQIRFRKVLVEDDGSITELGYHRTAVMPGDDLERQLDGVDTHLQAMKNGGLPQEEKDFIDEVKTAMWTQERIDAKQAQIAEQRETGPGGALQPTPVEEETL